MYDENNSHEENWTTRQIHSVIMASNRNLFGNSSNMINQNNNFANGPPVLSESCKITVNKLIDEIDLYMAIIAFDYKQRKLWPKQVNGDIYAKQLIEISKMQMYKLMMEVTPPLSSLPPQKIKFVFDDMYQRCARKWMQIDPAKYLRSINFIEDWISNCYGEIQRRNFIKTRGLNQSNKPDELMHPSQLAMLLSSTQNYVPQQTPPQATMGPQGNLCSQGNQMSQLKPHFMYSNVAQHPMPNLLATNGNSSNAHMKASQMQLAATIATQSPAAHPQPSANNGKTNGKSTNPAPPITLYMQVAIGQSPPTTISIPSCADSIPTKAKDLSPPDLLTDLTANRNSAPAITNDLPILDSADVANVLNEIPAKKSTYENNTEKNVDNRASKPKMPSDHFLFKKLHASRFRSPYASFEERNILKHKLITKCNAQNEQQIQLVNDNSKTNSTNEKIVANNPVNIKSNEKKIVHSAPKTETTQCTIRPKALSSLLAEKPNELKNAENKNTEDTHDYVILIETFTECKPKIEKIENIEEVLTSDGSTTTNPHRKQCDDIYDDLSDDSDSNALVIDTDNEMDQNW